MAKCRICKKELKKGEGYKVKDRYYTCSKEEFELAERDSRLFENTRELLMSLFNVSLPKGSILQLNMTIKKIREETNIELVNRICRASYDIVVGNKVFNSLPSVSKVRYLITVIKGQYEIMLKDFSKIEYNIVEDIEIKSNIIESKNDISKLLSELGEI